MVTALVKPGSDILASLTPAKCNLIHMTWGITGEFLEICQAMDDTSFVSIPGKSLENLIEELGDMEFFCEGFMQEMGWSYVEIIEASINAPSVSGYNNYLNAVEKVADIMKKHLMYNKPLTDEQLSTLKYNLARICQENVELMLLAGITREEALEVNMQKLTKGDTARYKTGSYSDQQAKDRADKAGA